MKRIALWLTGAVFLTVFGAATFIVVSSYLEHRTLVEAEKAAYPPPGQNIDVDGSEGTLHLYAEGQGEPTLVFLAGFGTSSPFYDFKILFERLSPDYRVAVMERAGYGWSDVMDRPRDLSTVVADTRESLLRSGETPPYVVLAHSMGSLEALYWAHRFPDEVAAIIGLDPLVPPYYESADTPAPVSRVVSFLARSGLMRHNEEVFQTQFPAMAQGHLDQDSAQVAETLFMRRVMTANMWDESRALPENIGTLLALGTPPVSFHALIASDTEDSWKDSIRQYTEHSDGTSRVLDGGHYIHLYQPDQVAREIRRIVEGS